MTLIKTDTGRRVLRKAESMILVPYVYNSTTKDYEIGGDFYDISAIIGDSIVIEQSEGDTITKENEFVSSPLIEMHSNSKYAFTAQCLDFQNKVLKSVFAAMTGYNTEGAAAFREDFVLQYAVVRIGFEGDSSSDLVMPKVQMNSRLMVDQLRTRASQGNLAGVALAAQLGFKNTTTQLLRFDTHDSASSTYYPRTPIMFVPKGKNEIFVRNNSQDSLLNFSSWTVVGGYTVSEGNGTWAVQHSGDDTD